MKKTSTQVASIVAVTLGLTMATTASAQNLNETDAELAGKIDWSGGRTDAEVNSLSQPTRFSQRSNIPKSRTGNEANYQAAPSRERGGTVPDRLNTYTNRSEPVVR